MDLVNSLKNSWNKNTLITSLVTKVIKDVFKREKKINISDYIISVSLLERTLLVKTNNPMINSELLLLGDIIFWECKNILESMWISVENIKYI